MDIISVCTDCLPGSAGLLANVGFAVALLALLIYRDAESQKTAKAESLKATRVGSPLSA
jgi:hypothetical protein